MVTTATEAAGAAARQLTELTGRDVEGVSGLERTDDGWRVRLDVVELHRIPETTDLLAVYDVDVDTNGELTSCVRIRRYSRGESGEEGGRP